MMESSGVPNAQMAGVRMFCLLSLKNSVWVGAAFLARRGFLDLCGAFPEDFYACCAGEDETTFS